MRAITVSLLLFTSTALAGCAELPEDDLAGEDAVAAQERAVDSATTIFDLIEPGKWGNIPLFMPSLEIHTCDNPTAETDDSVQIYFQTGTQTYSYWLHGPGDDFGRNHIASFVVPSVASALMQAKDLNATGAARARPG